MKTMSEGTALIKRATEALKFWMDETAHSVDWELLEDLESYLASEKQDQPEPVAWISHNGFRFNADIEPAEHGIEVPLYLHRAPRKPRQDDPVALRDAYKTGWHDGVNAANPKRKDKHDWADLTEDEAMEIFAKWNRQRKMPHDIYSYCLFISAALKKKNSSTIPSLNDTISANRRDLGHE